MKGFTSSPILAFDTESTGVSIETDRIVSATVVIIRPKQQPDVRSYLIAVDIDIPAEATAIHGISTEHARAMGKPAPEVLDLVAADLALGLRAGCPVVGMNTVFDVSLLDRELRRNHLPTLEDRLDGPIAPIVDVLCLDKAIDRYRKGKRKLGDLCAHYGVTNNAAHDATEDALAAARVAYRMATYAQGTDSQLRALYADRKRPDELVRAWQRLGQMTLAELHAAQVGWYRDQSENFAAYLRRQAEQKRHDAETTVDDAERATALEDAALLDARADAVTTDWPLIPFAPARTEQEALIP